ncbi:MAG TPA: 3-hydroxybutyrate dehydrogenase [Bacteroidia bacterium]|jgi:3-hydroxybutyrate dehydrogenase|nr:3-hydroxybutyrate dehydrogenase [Bacteroidia bacterium]
MQTGTALITGSTSGIGLGIAEKFASGGYNIIFNGLEKGGPQIAQSMGAKYGVKTFYSPANMLKPEEIRNMAAEGEKATGPITVLVNNAGIQFVSPIEDFPDEKWDQIIGINLTASFHTCKAVWKGMKERKYGRIVQIASAHGLVASEFKSAYVSAKHGTLGLTKTLALEGAAFCINVNAICPGYVHTPLVEKQIADQAKAHGISEKEVVDKIMLAEQPIKQFTTVEAIASLAFYLCGDQSNAITGAAYPIDGGWTAH